MTTLYLELGRADMEWVLAGTDRWSSATADDGTEVKFTATPAPATPQSADPQPATDTSQDEQLEIGGVG